MESGNLDGASSALAAVSNRPVTEALVLAVNQELGIESTLTSAQVAEAARAKQYDLY